MENTEKSNDIFISYRRADVEFTKQINEGLKQAGFTIWVDWDDIPPGVENFSDEIQRGIEGSVAFVCILSPSYLESPYCLNELAEAIHLKKRVVPIVLKKFEPAPPPDGIKNINWVYFTPHAGQENIFEHSFPKVIQAIKTDYEHSREHTKLLLRAIEWQKNGKSKGYLLTAAELEKAEHWQVAAAGKDPAPTELHAEYILASRKEAIRRQRLTLSGVSIALIVSVALAIVAWVQKQIAVKQSNLSQSRALVVNTQLSGSKIVSNLLLSLTSFNLVKKYDYPDRIVAEQSLRDSLSKESGTPLVSDQCPIKNLTFSPDGKWLATGSNDSIACLWNVKDFTAKPIILQAKDIGTFSLIFSPDSKWLATGTCTNGGGACDENVLNVWSIQKPSAPPTVLRQPSGAGGVSNLTFIPNSDRLVMSDYSTIFIWDINNPNAEPTSLQEDDNFASLAVSPDGRWLVAGSWDKTTRLWDLQNLSVGSSVLPGINIVVNTLAFSAKGEWLAAGGEDGKVYLWNANDLSGEPTVLTGNTVPGKAAPQINTLTFSPDSRWLATGSGGLLTLWDMKNPSQGITFNEINDKITTISFSADGQWVISGFNLWSLKNPSNYQKPLILHGLDSVNGVAFSSDSRWLAAAGDEGIGRLWDLKSNDSEFFFLHPFSDGVETTLFSPDGQWLYAHDYGTGAQIWDRKNTSTTPIVLDKTLSGAAFSPDSKWLAVSNCAQFDQLNSRVCTQGSAGLLDMTNPSTAPKIVLDHPVGSFVFSQDGQWLAAGDKVLNMKDLSAKPITPGGHYDALSLTSFSPDGRWLAGLDTTENKSTAQLWNMKDLSATPFTLKGEDPAKLQSDSIGEPGVRALAFSPDNQWIATSECVKGMQFPIVCLRSIIKLWDVNNLSKAPITSEIDSDWIGNLVFSHNSLWLVSDSGYLWDMKNPSKAPINLVDTFGEHSSSFVFSRDDQWLAIGTILVNMKYLNTDPLILNGHDDRVNAVAFSPDGKWLASGSDDTTVRLWSLDTDQLLQEACRLTGRNFTREEWKKYFPGQDYPAKPQDATCIQWALDTVKTSAPGTPVDESLAPTESPAATEAALASNLSAPTEGAVPTESLPQEGAMPTETAPPEGAMPTQPSAVEVSLATEPPATASPVPDASNTYTEEFDGNLDAWTRFMITGVDKQVDATLANGNLEVKLSPYQDKEPRVYWINNSYTYTDVQVDMVTTNNGNNANGAALICQYSDLGWYVFTVSNSGLYGIYGFDPNRVGDDRYVALANGGSSAIKFGQATNTYTAVCKGNELSLYVNGTLVKDLIDKTLDLTQGKIGFGAVSPWKLPVDLQLESVSVSIPK